MQNPFTGNDDPIEEFIYHSNLIEQEDREEAFIDAMDAWRYALKNRTNMDISTLLGIHRHLMKRIASHISGQFRDCGVFIGGQSIHFAGKSDLQAKVSNYLRKFDPNEGGKFEIERYDYDKEKYARGMHVEFEKIHPFFDGNGRVGRILYNIHRLLLGLPLDIIHAGSEQFEYCQWFKDNPSI